MAQSDKIRAPVGQGVRSIARRQAFGPRALSLCVSNARDHGRQVELQRMHDHMLLALQVDTC